MKKILGGIAAIVSVAVVFAVVEFMPATREATGTPVPQQPPPPQVSVMVTEKRQVFPTKEYIARVEPISQVELQAQVSGYIEKVHFEEGSVVKQGDLLFTIDPAQYRATVEQREAELASSRATLSRTKKYLAMVKAADNRSVSQSDMDKAESDLLEAKARVKQAKAALKLAAIDLGHTRVTSPISGRIGRALVTRGNYVSPSSSTLTRIIQWDPVRVVFSMPDSAYLAMVSKKEQGMDERVDARIQLSDGTLLGRLGTSDFADNQMNPNTGTMALRLRFSNTDDRLVPNAYVKVVLQEQGREETVLLPQAAILPDRDGAYVWTLDTEGRATRTPVTPGETLGVNRIIESGLEPGQQVIVSGTQKVGNGMEVRPFPVISAPVERG